MSTPLEGRRRRVVQAVRQLCRGHARFTPRTPRQHVQHPPQVPVNLAPRVSARAKAREVPLKIPAATHRGVARDDVAVEEGRLSVHSRSTYRRAHLRHTRDFYGHKLVVVRDESDELRLLFTAKGA